MGKLRLQIPGLPGAGKRLTTLPTLLQYTLLCDTQCLITARNPVAIALGSGLQTRSDRCKPYASSDHCYTYSVSA